MKIAQRRRNFPNIALKWNSYSFVKHSDILKWREENDKKRYLSEAERILFERKVGPL